MTFHMPGVPWWQRAAPQIHTSGRSRQHWVWHDPLRVLHDHELMLFGRGFRGAIDHPGGLIAIDGPSWILIPCGVPHLCRGETTDAPRCWVHFDWTASARPMTSLFTYGGRVPAGAIHRPPSWAPSRLRAGLLGDPSLIDDHALMTRAWSAGGVLDAVRARNLLLQMLASLLESPRDDPPPPRRALAEQVRQRLDQVAATRFADAPTLPRILAELDRDSDHLSRVFRQTFGMTPIRYLAEQRVGRARGLLRSGATAKAVAAELGFRDAAYLSRLVRKITGHPPRWHASRAANEVG